MNLHEVLTNEQRWLVRSASAIPIARKSGSRIRWLMLAPPPHRGTTPCTVHAQVVELARSRHVTFICAIFLHYARERADSSSHHKARALAPSTVNSGVLAPVASTFGTEVAATHSRAPPARETRHATSIMAANISAEVPTTMDPKVHV